VILARRPLGKLEALRRDYAKTHEERLVEEARVWADTQYGPDLTRIPLRVRAQDYVRGDPNTTRKDLEQRFFENRQAMRECERVDRLWHEQHPHQEQHRTPSPSPKHGRGVGHGF
jgi:acetylornithine deacetylase/succinyl-diaminopimelate desuccinylase-like protein